MCNTRSGGKSEIKTRNKWRRREKERRNFLNDSLAGFLFAFPQLSYGIAKYFVRHLCVFPAINRFLSSFPTNSDTFEWNGTTKCLLKWMANIYWQINSNANRYLDNLSVTFYNFQSFYWKLKRLNWDYLTEPVKYCQLIC